MRRNSTTIKKTTLSMRIIDREQLILEKTTFIIVAMHQYRTSGDLRKKFKTAAKLTVLIGALGLVGASPNAVAAAVSKQEIKAKEERLVYLQDEVQAWGKVAAMAQENRNKKLRLDQKIEKINERQAELDQLKHDIEELQRRGRQLQEKFVAHTERVRKEFASKEIPELRTKDGKVYKKVKIKGYEPGVMKIEHQNGIASLQYFRLPNDIQNRLNFDLERAEKFAQEKEKKRIEQQRLFLKVDQEQQRKKEENRQQLNGAPPKGEMLSGQQVSNPNLKKKNEPKYVRGRISVEFRGNKRTAHKLLKKIRVTAKAGTKALSVRITRGGQGFFRAEAGNEVVREYWLDSKYEVSAYEDGKLIDQKSDRRK